MQVERPRRLLGGVVSLGEHAGGAHGPEGESAEQGFRAADYHRGGSPEGDQQIAPVEGIQPRGAAAGNRPAHPAAAQFDGDMTGRAVRGKLDGR